MLAYSYMLPRTLFVGFIIYTEPTILTVYKFNKAYPEYPPPYRATGYYILLGNAPSNCCN